MRSGGSYRIGKDGQKNQVEQPTENHPEGNRARPAEEKAAPTGKGKTTPKGDDAPKGK
jgi:hypothetical protein